MTKGDWVEKVRWALDEGVRPKDMANLLGVSVTTVNHWTMGKCAPHATMRQAAAKLVDLLVNPEP